MSKWGGLLAAAAIACGSATSPATAQVRGGTLQFSLVAEPPNFDCHATITFAVIHPVAPIYSTLLKYDAKSYPKIVGDLAESWTASSDGLTYEFKLFDGVKFHDGTPLTSNDIKASYERIANPPQGIISARRSVYQDIASIETPDAKTVRFRMKVPNASMLDNFASPFNCIYSAAKLQENPRYPETAPMGTGAFQFVEEVRGSHFIAKRFDGYFRKGLPYLDGYKVFYVKSNAVVPGMLGGQFDGEFRTRSPQEKTQLLARDPVKWSVQETSAVAQMSVIFNVTKKPFDDIRVRRALSMAIDRWGGSKHLAAITAVKEVGGTMRPGSAYALPEAELVTLPGFSKDIEASRAEARRLLKEAGAEGLQFKLLNRAVGDPFTPLGVFAVDQFRRIGVTAEHQQVETKAYLERIPQGAFEVALYPPADAADDPNAQFNWILGKRLSTINGSQHSDELVDSLYEKQSRTLDVAERLKLVNQLDKYVISQAYNVPIIWYHRIVALNSRVKNWQITPSFFIGQDLSELWLDPAN